jgi:hypothetical protein
VLVGHSQGAAIAAVAAVALDDTNPTIITFGDPGSIIGSCSPIDVEKYYRFANTVEDAQGTLDYDPVPYYNGLADQRGKLFIMGDDPNNVVYFGDGNGPNIFQFGYQFKAHSSSRYVSRLQSYRDKSVIGTDGWVDGFACNVDKECIANCVDQRCGQGLGGNGAVCNYDRNCASGRCEGLWPSRKCNPKLGSGKWCDENSDCTSGTCKWTFTCA